MTHRPHPGPPRLPAPPRKGHPMTINATYLYLITDPNISITRTIEINPDLHVDLDDDGHVLGIESLAGSIGVAELIAVLRAVRVAGSEPSRG